MFHLALIAVLFEVISAKRESSSGVLTAKGADVHLVDFVTSNKIRTGSSGIVIFDFDDTLSPINFFKQVQVNASEGNASAGWTLEEHMQYVTKHMFPHSSALDLDATALASLETIFGSLEQRRELRDFLIELKQDQNEAVFVCTLGFAPLAALALDRLFVEEETGFLASDIFTSVHGRIHDDSIPPQGALLVTEADGQELNLTETARSLNDYFEARLSLLGMKSNLKLPPLGPLWVDSKDADFSATKVRTIEQLMVVPLDTQKKDFLLVDDSSQNCEGVEAKYGKGRTVHVDKSKRQGILPFMQEIRAKVAALVVAEK